MKKLSLFTVLFLLLSAQAFAGNFSGMPLYPDNVIIQVNQPQFFGWKIDNAAVKTGGTFQLLINQEVVLEGQLQQKMHQRFIVPMKLQPGQHGWTVKMSFNDGTSQRLTGFNFIVSDKSLAKTQSADLEFKGFVSNFQTGSFTGIAALIGDITALNFGNIRGYKNGQWINLGTGACYVPGEYLRKENEKRNVWVFKATLSDGRLSPENFDYITVIGMAYDKAGNEVSREIRSYPLGILSPRSTLVVHNYPNPFNPVTTISYEIIQDADVSLTVYNMIGQQVAILVNQWQQPGTHSAKFNASNLASGIYLYRLKVGDKIVQKRMILLK